MGGNKGKAGVTGEGDNVNCKVFTWVILSEVNLYE